MSPRMNGGSLALTLSLASLQGQVSSERVLKQPGGVGGRACPDPALKGARVCALPCLAKACTSLFSSSTIHHPEAFPCHPALISPLLNAGSWALSTFPRSFHRHFCSSCQAFP